ncbi:DEAD/DEAH box helicase, partial [Cardiobacterium hominis]
MTPLRQLLEQYRQLSPTERDKGTAFEYLIIAYLKFEPLYKEQYDEVLLYRDWVIKYGEQYGATNQTDTGIDLVAITYGGEFHAVQCKNFSADYTVQKSDIDSFFTASGKKYFSYRLIITTTDKWSKNADNALDDQQPPVARITLHDLESSVIDWSQFHIRPTPVLKEKKSLRKHQKEALNKVKAGFSSGAARGKIIMACGTGKTFTALRIAEALAGKGQRVLFLVPSLSLLSQTLREWTQDSEIPLINFAVCSDSEVGKKKMADDDRIFVRTSDLQFPATTHATSLARAVAVGEEKHDEAMTVIYSTYHSIDVIHQAQSQYGLPDFDLIICDEAHRTTGATFEGQEESAFVKVHDNDTIRGAKRLYMTATPRIYGDKAKETEGVVLYSMDDKTHYGDTFHTLNFSSAVSQGLLVDYKVIVLAIEEAHINRRLQDLLADGHNELKVDDAAKIVGCWKALSKYGLSGEEGALYEPMRRAVAFCQVIEKNYKGKKHKVSSRLIADSFQKVVEAYQTAEKEEWQRDNPGLRLPPQLTMLCDARHVDGGMNAVKKEARLQWLKEETAENTCRILSNVRCLSEGVDVPALDAVLFLTPRNSQVDVVQSVGRVMRLAKNKKRGYVILPVVIPAGLDPADALDKNENYRVVWQVLNALRAHDDRFDAMINKLEFNGKDEHKMEVIAIADKIQPKTQSGGKTARTLREKRGSYDIGSPETPPPRVQENLPFEVGEIERALYAKIVKKCGNRHHWEDWAGDIAKIANTHIDRIHAILADPANHAEKAAFANFAAELRDDLNGDISDNDIIEMLAQHMITQPVFDALFAGYSFAAHNPVSLAMQDILERLHDKNLHKERDRLQDFYKSVQMRAEGINSAAGKQKIIVELYDKFFRNAFPRMTERLGIVYTPVEVVDFIIHSVEDILRREFNSSLQDKGVHILDPFTGTGTFINRLLQSGIIPRERLPQKYRAEIHANEIVLLAYYIAAINIEATYHDLTSSENQAAAYEPFTGICLTDTFQMYEKGDYLNEMLVDNSARRKRQKALDIRVIIGNPPYSAGQESANDNNANIAYPHLDERIRQTYAAQSTATSTKNLMDSYIRAIRWASDRIKEKGDKGIIGFVTNAGWIDANTTDGLRQCLVEEFSSLYIFHLRGNARTSGERRRQEKDNVFGQGTRTPIAISILVKNPQATKQGQIYYHDIGDYLTREEKLATIAELGSINGITAQHGWQEIIPDEHNDWLNQRDPNFDNYISLGNKKDKAEVTIFDNYSLGLGSNRDAWVYNFSNSKLERNMQTMINCYNQETYRFQMALNNGLSPDLNDFIEKDETKISWSSSLIPKLEKGITAHFSPNKITIGMYRPFSKQFVYYDRMMNHRVGQIPQIFPSPDVSNQVISVTGRGATKEFSALITDQIPDLEMISKGQCFPNDLFEPEEDVEIAERTDGRTDGRTIIPTGGVKNL